VNDLTEVTQEKFSFPFLLEVNEFYLINNEIMLFLTKQFY